jgi:hypothetical protein
MKPKILLSPSSIMIGTTLEQHEKINGNIKNLNKKMKIINYH